MIPVYVVDLDGGDPKKCTGKRMEKFGLGKSVSVRGVPPGAIVLSANGNQILSPADAKKARRGIAVLDMTWTNIDQEPHMRGVLLRRLPYLLASNPVNWGKPWQLNSAEAVLASLLIMGFDEQADLFMPRFNWAPSSSTSTAPSWRRTAPPTDPRRSIGYRTITSNPSPKSNLALFQSL
jgi:pre-rRNA-processing protein TSR3